MDSFVTKKSKSKDLSEDEEINISEEMDSHDKQVQEHTHKVSDKFLKRKKEDENKVNMKKRRGSPKSQADTPKEKWYYAVVAKSLEKYGGAGTYDNYPEADNAMRAAVNNGQAKIKKHKTFEEALAWIKTIQYPKDLDKGSFTPIADIKRIVKERKKK